MISKQNFIKTRNNCLCDNPELIENYEQAINDESEIWVCHHRDEVKTLPNGIKVFRSREELIENIGISPSNKNTATTEFGRKYIEHFGYGKSVNEKQYRREHYLYQKFNKCSWE